MTLSRLEHRRADRLAELLDPIGPGPRNHRRTSVDDDVLPLARIVHQLKAQPPEPSPGREFAASLRSFLVATAEQDGVGAVADTAALQLEAETTAWLGLRPLPSHAVRPRRPALRPAAERGPGRTRIAVLAGVALGAIVLSGVSAASNGAVPGDPLYGVKRSTEQAQLAFAGSDASRGKLYLEFAHSRLAEAQVRHDDVGPLLADMDAETRKGVAFMAGAAVAGDRAALAGLDAFARAQRSGLDLLAAALSPAVRDSATRRSRRLLIDVQTRVSELRTALERGCPITAVDYLGPSPGAC